MSKPDVRTRHQSNHHPIAAFSGDSSNHIVQLTSTPGQTLVLDASASSDPDGDNFNTSWWIYHEAGTYRGDLTFSNGVTDSTSFTTPDDAAGTEIHIVLEVIDENEIVSLTDYRRIVVSVAPSASQ